MKQAVAIPFCRSQARAATSRYLCSVTTVRCLRLFFLFAFIVAAKIAAADSWSFDPVKEDRVETFGSSRIVLTTDARKNSMYPDYVLSIYYKDELRAQYRGLAFQQLFASPDNSRFLGLSNRGLPGTAVVLFDKDGNLLLEVKHGLAAFNYCTESVTLVRKWFDEKKPDVKFVANEKHGGYQAITLRDCKGNTTDLIDLVLQAYNRSFQQSAASGIR